MRSRGSARVRRLAGGRVLIARHSVGGNAVEVTWYKEYDLEDADTEDKK